MACYGDLKRTDDKEANKGSDSDPPSFFALTNGLPFKVPGEKPASFVDARKRRLCANGGTERKRNRPGYEGRSNSLDESWPYVRSRCGVPQDFKEALKWYRMAAAPNWPLPCFASSSRVDLCPRSGNLCRARS